MPLFRGSGGAVYEIDSPDPAQLASGALVPVEPPTTPPSPRKRAPKRTAEEA